MPLEKRSRESLFRSLVVVDASSNSCSTNLVSSYRRSRDRIFARVSLTPAKYGKPKSTKVSFGDEKLEMFSGAKASRTEADISRALARLPRGTVAAFATGHSIGYPGNSKSVEERQLAAAAQFARFSKAIDALPQTVVAVLCFAAEDWGEEMASICDAAGVPIAYDDTKRLVRFGGGVQSPGGMGMLSITQDKWKVRFARLPEDGALPGADALHAWYRERTRVVSAYKSLQRGGIRLPHRECPARALPALSAISAVMSGGLVDIPEKYPAFPSAVGDDMFWNEDNVSRFLQQETTFFSQDRRWRNYDWYLFHVAFEQMLSRDWAPLLWNGPLSGTSQKMAEALSDEGCPEEQLSALLETLASAAEELGISGKAAAFKAGVPLDDIYA